MFFLGAESGGFSLLYLYFFEMKNLPEWRYVHRQANSHEESGKSLG